MLSRIYLSFFLVLFFSASFLFSLAQGSVHLSPSMLIHHPTILLDFRLPRTLTAFVAGSLLALAGTLMQLLLRNPLADPYVLGVSSGSALFILIGMLLGMSSHWQVVGAWLGSFATILLILMLAKQHRFQAQTLLLTGIALACGFSAAITFLLLISPNTALHSMLFWLSGDLNDAEYPWLGLIILALGSLITFILAPSFNILARGEKEARALGLPDKRIRLSIYLLSSLFTATAVSLAGCIGFVGLLVPHICRLIIGYDHRYLLPTAALTGGSLLMLADTFARTWFAPQQLPVGILLALLGVPVFIGLLQKCQY